MGGRGRPPAALQAAREPVSKKHQGRSIPRLDSPVKRQVDVYEHSIHLGTVLQLASGKFAAVSRGVVLGYFHHEVAARRRLTDRGRQP
jgi:hypothetical protein